MPALNIKLTHKSVMDCYAALDQSVRLRVRHEMAVRAF